MGYMGCGKSLIARALSKKIHSKSVDLDDFIEQKEQKKISAIFKEKGEIYFRKKETFYLGQLLNTPEKIIIALGGGTPCFGENMNLITKQKDCKSFYLWAGVDTLFERLKKEKNKRPLIKNIPNEALKTFIKKHLWERDVFYRKAHHLIKTDNLSVESILKKITKLAPFKFRNF